MLLQTRGTQSLHASAVLTSAGVLAFSGASGTGKSTIAHALTKRGYLPWADDAVAFDAWGAAVESIELPFVMRVRPFSAADEAGDRRHVVASSAGGSRAPLVAVFVLARVPAALGSAVCVQRLSSAQSFPAVLAHAYCFSLTEPERKRRLVGEYLRLAASVPVYELSFTAQPAVLPDLLDRIERVGLAG